MCGARCSGTWYLANHVSSIMNPIKVYSLVTSDADTRAVFVFVLMELSEKQSLSFSNRCIECQPSLVLVMRDPRMMNSRRRKPCFNRFQSLLWWCEHVVNFLG